MAAIVVTTAEARIVQEPIDQWTAFAAVAVLAEQAVRLNAAGKWVLAQADTAPNATGVYIALRSAGINQPLTAARQVKMTGIDPALAPPAAVYLSNTAGGLDTAAGTVSTLLGRVVEAGVVAYNCPT